MEVEEHDEIGSLGNNSQSWLTDEAWHSQNALSVLLTFSPEGGQLIKMAPRALKNTVGIVFGAAISSRSHNIMELDASLAFKSLSCQSDPSSPKLVDQRVRNPTE
jgi:hypothetical protein